MNECFSFRFKEYAEDARKSMIVYCSVEPKIDVLIKVIRKDVESSPIHRNVYVVVKAAHSDAFKSLLKNESFRKEFDSIVGGCDEKLCGLYVKPNGDVYKVSDDRKVAEELYVSIFKTGAIELFKNRNGVIASSDNYHFVKPSGDHCNKFIRASNLLVSGAEVSFLATALLPYLKRDLKRIYVDTSSISYLVSVGLQLTGIDRAVDIAIESFESYSVFSKAYDFVEDESSLIVISATTSGSLANRLLRQHRFGNHQIVTLFHLGLPDFQLGLFDISEAIPGGIVSNKEVGCDMCRRGSKVISISGDQFLPETPKHELVMIYKRDLSADREEFLQDFAARGILSWNQLSSPVDSNREHFFFSVDTLLQQNNEKFTEQLDRKIKRHLSRHMNAIITVGDTDSKALAYKIKESVEDIDLLHFSNGIDEKVGSLQSVLVVAGAITSGRKLLSISRKLRSIDPLATITYFVGVSKLPSLDIENQLKKDLIQGGHELVILRRYPLPRMKDYSKTTWDLEEEFLGRFDEADPLMSDNVQAPSILRHRAKTLSEREFTSNDLFLRTPKGAVLKIRPTFAFWKDLNINIKDATQADVYWTVQAVLHDMRLRSERGGLASTYHSTLISPACFDRYNDGVVQSAILRSATAVELNYSIDADYSRQMTDVIASVISSWDGEQGEAAMEFLLALIVGRLKICDRHLEEIADLKSQQMPDYMLFLIDQLGAKLKSI